MNTLTRVVALAATTALVAGVGLAEAATSATSPRAKAVHAATVEEGGQATLTVRLKRPAHKNTTFTWRTVDGTATGGTDFTAMKRGKVKFHKGYRKATLQVATIDDAAVEKTEHFFVQINGRKHAARLRHARLKVVIKDNDAQAPAPTSATTSTSTSLPTDGSGQGATSAPIQPGPPPAS